VFLLGLGNKTII